MTLSATGRGVTEADVEKVGGSFAMPDKLVALTFEHDRALAY